MTKTIRARYTLEFKQEAVRLVEGGQSQASVAKALGLVEQTLFNWAKAWIQESSATRFEKLANSSAIASSGVLQSKVLRGRPLRSRAMSLSIVWLAVDRSVPLGRN